MRNLQNLAEVLEKKGAESGLYPPNWPHVARAVKELADWKCERCKVSHGNVPHVLTVHHLDGNKRNLKLWNLAALCQRCHLRIQSRVDWYRDTLDGTHSEWMAKHVQAYNEWAKEKNRPQLKLNKVVVKDYSDEWN